MKKVICVILVLILSVTLAACNSPKNEVIVFNDSALESKVRVAMDKPEGDITLEDAQSLTELDLSNEWQDNMPSQIQIKDISVLSSFVNLTLLDVTFNALTDISALSGLTKLTSLKLGGNQISDINALAELTNLTELYIWGNPDICDIGALSVMTDLTGLYINGTGVSDISMLLDMKKLKTLNMSNCRVTDISVLAGLPIDRLMLNGNGITDFSSIEGIYDNLIEKDFEMIIGDDISDEPLVFADAQFEKALRTAMNIFDRPITQRDAYLAQSLSINNDKSEGAAFSDISPLSYFVNLTSLEFNANNISDLSPLSGLTKLRSLNVSFNQVTDLRPLSGLIMLEQLRLKNNYITDVSPLAGLTNLWELILSDNQITDYSPLNDIYPNLTSKDF
jgi:internalin A